MAPRLAHLLALASLALLQHGAALNVKVDGNKSSNQPVQCLDAAHFLASVPSNPAANVRKYSQGNQDGVLQELFHQIGTTNKGFVEFGFPDHDFSTSYGNGRHLIEALGFHAELLLDGASDNPAINLHKKFLYADNIVSIFDQQGVSLEPDYVSVDVDSCDIWLFMSITSKYKPRVMTVEYNSNYPLHDFSANNGCTRDHTYLWKGDNIFGASLAAIYQAAQRHGYTMVYSSAMLDTFLVRNDLICPGTAPPLESFAYATAKPIHSPYHGEQGPVETLVIDFKQWLEQNPNA